MVRAECLRVCLPFLRFSYPFLRGSVVMMLTCFFYPLYLFQHYGQAKFYYYLFKHHIHAKLPYLFKHNGLLKLLYLLEHFYLLTQYCGLGKTPTNCYYPSKDYPHGLKKFSLLLKHLDPVKLNSPKDDLFKKIYRTKAQAQKNDNNK